MPPEDPPAGFRPSREIIVPRVRCPFCGAPKRRGNTGPTFYKTRELPDGNTRQSTYCRSCGRSFHVIETDFVHTVDTPISDAG